jgi:hypothetical protein
MSCVFIANISLLQLWSSAAMVLLSVSPVCHQCVTILSPVFHQSVTSVSPVCHQCVTSVSQVCHQSVTSVTSVSPVCHQCTCRYHCCYSSQPLLLKSSNGPSFAFTVVVYSHRCFSLKITAQKCTKQSVCQERMQDHDRRMPMTLRAFLISYITHLLIHRNIWRCRTLWRPLTLSPAHSKTLWRPLTQSPAHSSTLVTWCQKRQQRFHYFNKAYSNSILLSKPKF